MAQKFTTDFGTLVIPGASATYQTQVTNSGIATSGILMLVGEADAGPAWTLEAKLQDNGFGPDEEDKVIAKYKSGPIVDAFRAACAPADDPNIKGAPTRIVIAKTNASTKASLELDNYSAAAWGTLQDKSYGKTGNLIFTTVTAATTEVVPTTGAFTFIPPTGDVHVSLRSNGAVIGADVHLTAGMTPTAAVSALTVSGVTVTGGAATDLKHSGTVNGTITLGAGPDTISLVLDTAFPSAPSVGQTLVIDSGSAFDATNQGAYLITSVTAPATLTATKLADSAGGTPGVVTAPTAEGPLGVLTGDLIAYGRVTVAQTAANPVDGLGKSLEIADLGTGTDLAASAMVTSAGAAVAFLSVEDAPHLITSATEYEATITDGRKFDLISEAHTAGGEIALLIGYAGTAASLTVDDTNFVVTGVTGGDGDDFAVALKDFPTLGDLAEYVATLPGFTCSVPTTSLSQLPTTALDDITVDITSEWGESPGRLKIDAYRMYNEIQGASVLVSLAAQPAAGLPAPATIAFMAGGARGATSAAGSLAAIDALEKVKGNFLITLFSRDASDDITDGLTDSSSDYEIDAINAYVKTHCLKLSTLKRQRNRQGFVAKDASFVDQKAAAGVLACERTALAFQNVKNPSVDGTIHQFQSWMAGVLAAAMQAAAFQEGIVAKQANITGLVHAAGDFDDQDDSQMEDALESGLLPLRQDQDGGGFVWVSDQTTYAKDENFVLNSIQAQYVADLMSLTCALRFRKKFLGKNVADISAPEALTFLEGVMGDFLALKWIAPSDDAKKGYKNAVIRVVGPAMTVRAEVKLSGLAYFINLAFLLSQVTQTATG